MIQKYLSLVKFSHTIFALPFAVAGFFLAVAEKNNEFDNLLFVKVLLCMVFARSAAMAFNRYLDRDIDKLNPRTKNREIPAGIMNEKNVLYFTIINSLLFIGVTYFINTICFFLSPVALIVILGYSFTKRYTAMCHIVLGLGLALAPVGAYLAVTGYFDVLPVLLGLAVLLWVAGFDIIYALQDDAFDSGQNLKSLPVLLGRKNALFLSRALHFCCILLMTAFVYYTTDRYVQFSYISWVALFLFSIMLSYQHLLVKANDLSRVGLAFFTFNGIASLTFGVLFITDFLVF